MAEREVEYGLLCHVGVPSKEEGGREQGREVGQEIGFLMFFKP